MTMARRRLWRRPRSSKLLTGGSIWKRRLCSSLSMLPLAGGFIGSAEAGLVFLYLGRAQVSLFSVAHLLAALFHRLMVCRLSVATHGMRVRCRSVAAAQVKTLPTKIDHASHCQAAVTGAG